MMRVRGVGPVYWGMQQESTHHDQRRVAMAFLVETLPPWRRSIVAIRLRRGEKEYHVGLCRKGRDPERTVVTEVSDPVVVGQMPRMTEEQIEATLWDS